MNYSLRSALIPACPMRLIAACILVCAGFPGWPAAAADPAAGALKTGGVALLMRHATAPGGGDPPDMRIGDCASQRNLSEAGRLEAQRIGAHLKKLGLVPGEVLSSQWCRARDTAQLAFGRTEDWEPLNSFLRNRETEPAQTSAVLARIARLRRGDRPLVPVTHQLIVTAVTGIFPESGEGVVVAPAGAKVRVIGSIKPAAASGAAP